MTTSSTLEITLIQSLKRKNFQFGGNVVVEGDVDIADTLVVAGDLHVKGSCRVKNLYCLGHVTIQGGLRFGAIRLLGVLTCESDASGDSLVATDDAKVVAGDLKRTPSLQCILDFHSRREVQSLFVRENNAYPGGDGSIVKIADDLTVNRTDIDGALDVGGDFVFKDAVVQGCISAGGSVIGNNLEMTGTATIARSVNVRKRLFSWCDLSCGWTCHGGDIEVHGDLEANHAITASGNLVSTGHVKSDNRIQVRGALIAGKSIQSASSVFAGQNITAGKDYGIYAGLAVPRSLHHAHGYIACPSKPRRIRTGEHVTDQAFKKLKKSQRISWPASDGADGIY